MECLTGKYKFGSNFGCAKYLVELKNSKSTEINLVINLEEESDELTKYCSEIGNSNVFAVKSSEKKEVKEKKNRTVEEIDREKLDKKFSKKKEEKLK